MATNLGSKVAYLERFLSIKSHDPSGTWSCEIVWLTKAIIIPLRQCPWPPNLAQHWLTLSSSHQKIYQTIWQLNLIGCRLQRGGLARKRLSRHRLLLKYKLMVSTKLHSSFDCAWTFFVSSWVCPFLNFHRDVFDFYL